jgi:hypothetical protein
MRDSLENEEQEFDINSSKTTKKTRKAVTFWITEDYKDKYDVVQENSDRRFCKHLNKLLMREIDKNYSKVS